MSRRTISAALTVLAVLAAPLPASALAGTPGDGTTGTELPSGSELWAERPEESGDVVVTVVNAAGRPHVLTIEGVGSRSEATEVVEFAEGVEAWAAPRGGEVHLEWDGQVQVATSDPSRSSQWGHDAVNVAASWETTRGAGMVVAVVDSGVQLDHPDLAANLVAGYDFVQNDATPQDVHGHGTHVAGIVAAVAGNGIGVAGAAPEAEIMPVRVLGSDGTGTMSAVANGITWAAENGADVVNLSLGGTSRSSAVTAAITYARSLGVVVVAAAGNDGSAGAANWPAAEPDVLGVAATQQSGGVASFSTWGSYVDVAAPGASILSTTMGSGYGYMSGTSMATPYVAALAALVKAANPGMTEAQIRGSITSTSQDLAPAGFDNATGYGLISFPAAVPPPAWGAPAPSRVSAVRSGFDTVVTATAVSYTGVVGYQVLKDGVVVATPSSPVYTDPGAATVPGAVVYQVRAVNSYGQNGAAAATTHTVAVPATPTVVSSVSGSTVTLTPTSAGATAPTQWLVYEGMTLVSTARAGGAASITRVSVGEHTYTVRAAGTTGVSAASAATTVTVLPQTPSQLTVTRSGLNLRVSASSVNGATSYAFFRNGMQVAAGSAREYIDVDAATGAGAVEYAVQVTMGGYTSLPRTVTHTRNTPTTPTITSTSSSGADLVLHVTAPGATHLMVYRDGALWTTVPAAATVAAAGMALSGFAWQVRAANPSSASELSNTVNVAGGMAAPQSVTVTRSGPDLRVTAAVVSGARSYEFYRNGALVGTSRTAVWTDSARATVAGEHTYGVRAVSSDGRRSAAQPAAAWTVSAIAAPSISGSAEGHTVNLTVSAPGATELLVYRNGTYLSTHAPAASLTLTAQDFGPGSYTVRSATASSVSAASTAVPVTIAATPQVSAAVSGTSVAITVVPIPGARNYEFFRNGTRVATSAAPTHTDSNIALNAGGYTYTVVAVRRDGVRSSTGTASITLVTPAAPTLTSAVYVGGRGVNLTVAPVAGAVSYLVYRNGVLVASSNSAGVISLSRQSYGSMTYRVRVATATGASDFSNALTVVVS